MDISVSFPNHGRIRLQSRMLFEDPRSQQCRRFLERVVETDLVREVAVQTTGRRGQPGFAEIHYCHVTYTPEQVVERVSVALHGLQQLTEENGNGANGNGANGNGSNGNGNGNGKGKNGKNGKSSTNGNGNGNGTSTSHRSRLDTLHLEPDRRGMMRLYRHDSVVSAWEVKHELPGRIRLRNSSLHRKASVCEAIERELMSVLGVDNYKTSPSTCTVLITYHPSKIQKHQIIEILDHALASADGHNTSDKHDLDFPLCTLSVPLAAAAQFAMPALLPVSAALFAYTSIPSFKEGYHVVTKERRLGVDVLDCIVVVGCLATGSVFAGAVLCWCLSFGRILVKKTQDNSKKMLLNVFGKQPRFVWKLRDDGTEVETLLDDLDCNDVIVVHTGETVPVDGIVKEGMAMVDQHSLTGESTPAEKGVGDRVFASTVMVAGKVFVSVEKAGSETTSAKISQILNDSAGYKLSSQHKGERLADRAVIPTLALGTAGLAVMGPAGAVAVLNSDFGTGIRMAAPLGMLTSLTLCAQKGILVKDGRALELMTEIDTVLFDKTGTLTRERPEVGQIYTSEGHDPNTILQYAAAAEQKFAHPIAKAILHEFEELGMRMPETDESKYHVGFGITVGVEGRTIRVGSARFMEMEGLPLTDEIAERLEQCHLEGNTMVMVGVDDALGGAIELQASQRPEVGAIMEGLRARGIKHIAIISGDHEAPTKKLAEELGMDRYFAGVLPADKADYVEKLQQEGKKVCFVGDGINDSIALKKANVSISLRGASSIATDTAQIVFMEESLSKLCDLMDISKDLESNIRRSWNLILAPNILCIGGAFFLGFGIMASVVTNNVAALAALANGMLPLRKVAEEQAKKEMEEELRLEYAQN